MLYPEIPERKTKGTYIGGGIFLLLFGMPLLLLFLPYITDDFFNFSLWDWNMAGLGINVIFINSTRVLMTYFVLPIILIIINFIGLFIGKSKTDKYFKASSFCFLLGFAIKYAPQKFSVAENILSILSYVSLGLFAIGIILLIVAFIKKHKQPKYAEKASFFLIFTAVFWAIFAILDASLSLANIAEKFTKWVLPIGVCLFGFPGGLVMLCCCKRKFSNYDGKTEQSVQPQAVNSGANGNNSNESLSPQNQTSQNLQNASNVNNTNLNTNNPTPARQNMAGNNPNNSLNQSNLVNQSPNLASQKAIFEGTTQNAQSQKLNTQNTNFIAPKTTPSQKAQQNANFITPKATPNQNTHLGNTIINSQSKTQNFNTPNINSKASPSSQNAQPYNLNSQRANNEATLDSQNVTNPINQGSNFNSQNASGSTMNNFYTQSTNTFNNQNAKPHSQNSNFGLQNTKPSSLNSNFNPQNSNINQAGNMAQRTTSLTPNAQFGNGVRPNGIAPRPPIPPRIGPNGRPLPPLPPKLPPKLKLPPKPNNEGENNGK